MYNAKRLSKGIFGVFDQSDNQVGQFERSYDSFGESTFTPFERNGKWFGLYSPSYVALSVLSLPDCIYVGGEDQKNSCGFCPVEVYIPTYQWSVDPATPVEDLHKYPEQNHHWLSRDRFEKEYDQDCWEPGKAVFSEDFAFVAGCQWGDDSSWKIEIRDISEAHNGIIKPIENWGYYEMPHRLNLKESIRLNAFSQYDKKDRTSLNITLSVQKHIRFHTNNKEIFDLDNEEDRDKLYKEKTS